MQYASQSPSRARGRGLQVRRRRCSLAPMTPPSPGTPKTAPTRLRTGNDFLSNLRCTPRAIYVDGEKVTNPVDHPAFRDSALALAHLFDHAASPEHREVMTFTSPDTGGPVWRCYQIPRSHADLRAKRIAAEAWAEQSFRLMGRTPDHRSNFFAGSAPKPQFFAARGAHIADHPRTF